MDLQFTHHHLSTMDVWCCSMNISSLFLLLQLCIRSTPSIDLTTTGQKRCLDSKQDHHDFDGGDNYRELILLMEMLILIGVINLIKMMILMEVIILMDIKIMKQTFSFSSIVIAILHLSCALCTYFIRSNWWNCHHLGETCLVYSLRLASLHCASPPYHSLSLIKTQETQRWWWKLLNNYSNQESLSLAGAY